MTSAAIVVITDAELQTDVKVICQAYALQVAQFELFYPRFTEALGAASQRQPILRWTQLYFSRMVPSRSSQP